MKYLSIVKVIHFLGTSINAHSYLVQGVLPVIKHMRSIEHKANNEELRGLLRRKSQAIEIDNVSKNDNHHFSTSTNILHQENDNHGSLLCNDSDELTFGLSIVTNGNSGEILWSIESSNDATITNGPFNAGSQTTKYYQQLCLNESLCHTFTMKDTYGNQTQQPHAQPRNMSTSFATISINNALVFQNPGHSFTSFSFHFGQCEQTDSVTTASWTPPFHYHYQHQSRIQSLNPSSSANTTTSPTATFPSNKENDITSNRNETFLMVVVIVLILFVVIPRLGSLFCCFHILYFVKSFKTSLSSSCEEKNDDKNNAHDKNKKRQRHDCSCDDTTANTSASASCMSTSSLQEDLVNGVDNEGKGKFQSLMGKVSSGISLVRDKVSGH